MADPDTETDNSTETLALDEQGDVRLPIVDVLTGRAFLSGKSGSGKSNSASVVVEELLDRGYPVLIVDTDGEYYGLKEEYELLHAGADEECDIQVSVEHAEKLATLALEENVPIILDISGYLDTSEANDLVRETARFLFTKEKKLKKPFLLVVEECHEYIPQSGGMNETGEMLVKIGKRGRKHGLGLMGISQRPADVKKDFITQANWLLWHRLTWDNDTQVVGRVVGNDYKDAVQDLDDGEAFLQADFLETDVQRVQVRRKRTFDAGATPDLDDFERPDLKSVSGDLVDELEEISEQEQRRQDRIAELEARIEDLQDEKAELEDELEAERQNSETVDRLADKLMQVADGDTAGSSGEALEEIREEKNARIRELEADLEDAHEENAALQERVDELEAELNGRPEISDRAVEAVEVLAGEFDVAGGGNETLQRKLQAARERNDELESRVDELQERLENGEAGVSVPSGYEDFVDDPVVREQIEAAKDAANTSPRYVKGVIATILQQRDPVTRDDVADHLGIKSKSDVGKAAGELVSRKVLEENQDGRKKTWDLNVDGIREVKEAKRRRERTEEVMEDL